MNVFDFDNTIYRGDSTVGFVLYLYSHRPATLLSIPRTALFGILYGLRIVPKLTFKKNLYQMFTFVKDMDQTVEEYTASHMDHIKTWYRDMQREDDLVISASPEFLIGSFCRRIGIRDYMASRVNIRTGEYDGENCHGKEKVRRFYERYPEGKIEAFYSDSRSDSPLAEIAAEAWLVRGDRLEKWQEG